MLKSTLTVFLFIPLFALAQEKDSATGKTFLWQISGNGLQKTAYLFGDMTLCRNDVALSSTLKEKISAADEVYFDEQPHELRDSADRSIFSDEDVALAVLISKKNFARLKKSLHISDDSLNRMKPRILANSMLWTSIGCASGSYSYAIRKMVREEGIKENCLETLEEFFNRPKDDPKVNQAYNLTLLLNDLQKRVEQINTSMALYKQQELMKLYNDRMYYKDGTISRTKKYVDSKNQLWLPRIEKALSTNKTLLFVVPFLSIAGKDGLINLLRDKGYTVSPVFD